MNNENSGKVHIVKQSREGKHILWEKDGRYLFSGQIEDGKPVIFLTASARPVMTMYRGLADAILDDLDTYGPKSEDLRSVAKWHQDLVEHYISLENDSFAEIVKTECFHETDWTEAILKQDAWTMNFRNLLLEQDSIAAWIEKCTHMQMNAILHLYRALKSVRVAFAVAHLMENIDDDCLDDQLEIIIQWIADNSEFAYFFVYRIIHLFKLYYGIHLDEHGKIIRVDTDDADALFIGKKVTQDVLIGRNYDLYEDGLMAVNQPQHLQAVDIVIDRRSDPDDENGDYELDDDDEDETDHEYDDDMEDDYYDELEEYLPERCWIKRISALEDEHESYLLVVVEVDEEDTITGVSCIHEEVIREGGGLFFIPVILDAQTSSEYEELDYIPSKAFHELACLVMGRALVPGFSLIGKPIPAKMIKNNENQSFALQSGYRSAYMHMNIDADHENCIKGLEYTTYQSNNSAYGDLFMRPQLTSDREDEAIDMLIYMIDQYNEDEWKRLKDQQ